MKASVSKNQYWSSFVRSTIDRKKLKLQIKYDGPIVRNIYNVKIF